MAHPALTTIVIINHNYGRFVGDAVRSSLRQTRQPRVMVIDDASTDDSSTVIARICAEHSDIDFHPLPANIGLARVRNLAADLVSTEWVLFLDADDWLHEEYLARAEAWLAAHPPVDVLTTDMTIVRDARRRVVRARLPEYWDDLMRRNTIVQTSFIRRALIHALGGFDPSLDFEDWDFWLRAKQAGARFGRLPGAHVFHREHGANKSKLCDERAATDAVRHKHGRMF